MNLQLLERDNSSQALSNLDWKLRESRQNHSGIKSQSSLASLGPRAIEIPFGKRGVFRIEDELPTWLKSSIDQIAALGDLDANWDSYGARPIDPFRAANSIAFVINAIGQNLPLPSVVPTNRGGVQLEWHCNAVDLEIEFMTASRLRVSFDDLQTGDRAEFEASGDWRPIFPYLERLAEPVTTPGKWTRNILTTRRFLIPQLWRRIPPHHFVHDNNTGGYRPSSAAFDDHHDGSPMSVALGDDVRAAGRVPESVLSNHVGFGLVEFAAETPRRVGLGIVRKPEPDEPAHAEVFGKKTGAVKKALVRGSFWLIPPGEDAEP